MASNPIHLSDRTIRNMVQIVVEDAGGQRKASKLYGVSQTTLSRFLREKEPAGDAILRMLKLRRATDMYVKR